MFLEKWDKIKPKKSLLKFIPSKFDFCILKLLLSFSPILRHWFHLANLSVLENDPTLI